MKRFIRRLARRLARILGFGPRLAPIARRYTHRRRVWLAVDGRSGRW